MTVADSTLTDEHEQQSSATLLDHALAYAEQGIPVFPIRVFLPEGKTKTNKVPLTPHGFLDASTDPEKIQEWFSNPRANGIGCPTGRTPWHVVDCDGFEGANALEDWASTTELGSKAIPPGPTLVTPSGGYHLLIEPIEGARNLVGMLPHVDYRGDGGFAVLPPSYDGAYLWVEPLDLKALRPATGPLKDLVLNKQARPVERRPIRDRLAARSRVAGAGGGSYGETALRGQLESLASSVPGQRNTELNGVAYRIYRLVKRGDIDEGVATDGLIATARSIGLGDSEIEKTLESARDGAFKAPTLPPLDKSSAVAVPRAAGGEDGAPVAVDPAADPGSFEEPYASYDFIDAPVDVAPTVPTVGLRSDGQHLFYPATINIVFGDSGAGKSLQMTLTAAQEIQKGRHVVWVDYEDTKATLDGRLAAVGITSDDNTARLHYCNPDDPWDELASMRLTRNIAGLDVSLVVVDSLGESLSIMGLSEDKDSDVAPLLSLWRRFALTTGAAVVIIDHAVKAPGANVHPSGTKRKKAAVNGAMFRADAGKPFSKDAAGYSKLVCTKDRHGNYGRNEVAAIFKVNPELDERFRFDAPREEEQGEEGVPKPVFDDEHVRLVRRCLSVLKQLNEPVSGNEALSLVREKGTFRASDQKIKAALDSAERVGCVERGQGKQRATTWKFIRDLDIADEHRLAGRFGGGF